MHFIHIKLFRRMLLHVSNRRRVHPQGVIESLITLTNHNMITKVGHNLKYICRVDKSH
jgi:hypothetical protein